jgi:curli biogenesis system outer membrane secretion channel CsgG
MNRKLYILTGWIVLLLFLTAGCSSLRTARTRKDVTITTHQDPQFKIYRDSTIAVIPSFHSEEGIIGFSYTANEAAADMLTLKLWNEGFRIVDRIFIKEILLSKEIEFKSFSVNQAVSVGEVLDADYVMLISLTDLEGDTRSIAFGPLNLVNTVDTSVLVGVNCRLIDVAAQQIAWSGAATTQDKNLQLCLRRISLHLIDTLHNGEEQRKDRAIPFVGIHY